MMTVQKLIDILKTMPPEAEVTMAPSDEPCVYAIASVAQVADDCIELVGES